MEQVGKEKNGLILQVEDTDARYEQCHAKQKCHFRKWQRETRSHIMVNRIHQYNRESAGDSSV